MDGAWDDEDTAPGIGSSPPPPPIDFQMLEYPRFVLMDGPQGICYLCARVKTNLIYQIAVGDEVFCCPRCALGPAMDLSDDFRREVDNMLRGYNSPSSSDMPTR